MDALMNSSLKKLPFCHHLLTLMSFQTPFFCGSSHLARVNLNQTIKTFCYLKQKIKVFLKRKGKESKLIPGSTLRTVVLAQSNKFLLACQNVHWPQHTKLINK